MDDFFYDKTQLHKRSFIPHSLFIQCIKSLLIGLIYYIF